MKKLIVCLIGIIIVFSLITYSHLFSGIKPRITKKVILMGMSVDLNQPDCNKAIYEHINNAIQNFKSQKESCSGKSCLCYDMSEKIYRIYNGSLSGILPSSKCDPAKLAAAGIIMMQNLAVINSICIKLESANFSEKYMENVLSSKLKEELGIEEVESKVNCQEFLDLLLNHSSSQIISEYEIISTKTCEDAAQIAQAFHKNIKESLEREDLNNVTKYALITLGKAIEKCGYWFNKEECVYLNSEYKFNVST